MEVLEIKEVLENALEREISNFKVVSSDKPNRYAFFGPTYDKGVQASIYISIPYALATGEMDFFDNDITFNSKVSKILEKFFEEQVGYYLDAVLDDLGYSEDDLEDADIFDEVEDTLNNSLHDLEPLITLNIMEEDGEIKYYASFIEKTFRTDTTILWDSIEGTFDELSDTDLQSIINELIDSVF